MPQIKTSRKLLLPAIATLCICATGGVTYWWLTQRQESSLQNQVSNQIIPQNAIFAASLTTDPAQWQQLRTYGTPETQAILNSQLANLEKEWLNANGYSYQKDIQPWIGKEIVLAYLPSDKPLPGKNLGTQQPMLAVLAIADPIKAQQILSNSSAPKGEERTYKDLKIQQTGNLSTAVLGSYLVASNSPKAIEAAVDTFLGNPSLGKTPGYLTAVSQIKSDRAFAHLYVNLPAATAIASQNSGKKLTEKVRDRQGMVATAILEPETIRFSGVYWLKPNSATPLAVENQANAIPTLLPTDTLMMVSGSNLQSLWQEYLNGAESNPIAPVKPQEIRNGIKSSTGLDLERDLLPSMKAEFSASLIPSNRLENSGVGLVLMVKTSDRSAANQTFSKLDDFVARKYQFKISTTQIGVQSAINWQSELGTVAATRGFLPQDFAFLNLGTPVVAQFAPQPQTKLVDNPLFKLASYSNFSETNGQFFLDLDKTVNAGNLSLPQLVPQQQTFTQAMRAIGLTTRISDRQTYRFELILVPKISSQTIEP
jgi:hypothetical protein